MTTTDLLSISIIRRRLNTEIVGRRLYLFDEVDSTNAKLKSLARSGVQEGAVVLAEGQTAGRGRRGQPWFSPSGVNLYASVLFRPAARASELAVFSFIASLAAADTLKDFGAPAGIKWPNDLLIDGDKVGGVLVEGGLRGNRIDYVVLGIGINLNVDPLTLREALGPSGTFATSLSAATGHEVDRNAFAAAYLTHLDEWLRLWYREGPHGVLAAWRDHDILTGRRVLVRGSKGDLAGRVLGVNATGSLLVEDPQGRVHVLTGEEVRVQGD